VRSRALGEREQPRIADDRELLSGLARLESLRGCGQCAGTNSARTKHRACDFRHLPTRVTLRDEAGRAKRDGYTRRSVGSARAACN
jgi:hypothetical protein